MSEAATLKDLESWIDKMMKAERINDYKLVLAGNSAKGDGYLGEVSFVTILCEKNGGKCDYNVVVKSAKSSDELRKQMPIKEAYDREICFYARTFPILDEFQKLKKIEKPFINIPRCYSVTTETGKEALILQNLKSIGFDLHDRKKPMNLNHVHMVFTQYGRYHALSLALKDQRPSVFKSLTKNMTDILAKFIIQGKMIDNFYRYYEHIMSVLKKNGHSDIVKKYEGFEKGFEKTLTHYTDENFEPTVITHGDCWNNNYMFKYEGNDKTKPIDMCFIDFQLSRLTSPIADLSYFLYACADQKILKNFDFILQAYYSSFSDYMSELGSDAEEIFPFKTLKQQWREYGKLGLLMASFALTIALCDSEDAPDFTQAAEKGDGFSNFHVQIKNQDEYDARMTDIYLHFAEQFL